MKLTSRDWGREAEGSKQVSQISQGLFWRLHWDLYKYFFYPGFYGALGSYQVPTYIFLSDTLRPHGLYSPWNSLGQNTGVGSFPFSRGSSQPRDRTQVSHIAGRFFTSWATREARICFNLILTSLIRELENDPVFVNFFINWAFILFKELVIKLVSRMIIDQWRRETWRQLIAILIFMIIAFQGGTSGKEPACQCKRPKRWEFYPWVRKIPWKRA